MGLAGLGFYCIVGCSKVLSLLLKIGLWVLVVYGIMGCALAKTLRLLQVLVGRNLC